MSSLASSSARGGVITVGSQGLTVTLRMVALVLLARLLDPAVFGLVAVAQAFALFASSLALMGLGMAAAQARELSHNAASVLFHLQAGLGLVLGAVMFMGAGRLAEVYDHADIEPILQWLSLVPVLQGLQSQHRIQLVRSLRFGALAVTEVVSLAVAVTASVALAVAGHGFIAITTQLVLQPLVQLVLLVVLTRWWPTLRVTFTDEVFRVLRIGLDILVMNLLRNVSRSLLTPVMGLTLSPASLGQFDRAQQLAVAPINLTVDQLQRVAVPVLSRLRDDPPRMLAYLLRAQLLTTYASATGFLVLAALCPLLVTTLLGERWGQAGTVLAVLAVGAAVRMLGETMTWVFVASESTRSGLRFTSWAQPAVVVVSLAGLPWGVVGVAVANTLAWLLYWPLAARAAARSASLPGHALPREALRILVSFSIPVSAVALAGRMVAADLGAWALVIGLLSAGLASAALAVLLPPVRRDLATAVQTLRLAGGR